MQDAASNQRALLGAAIAHHQAGRLGEAEKIYRDILAADPRHADSLHFLGVIATQRGRHDDAIALMERALALNDRAPQFHNNIAGAYRSRGDLNKAAIHFRRAVALKPDYIDAHANLAGVLEEGGQLDEALAGCRRALALKPDFARALYVLGTILLKQGQFGDAAAQFERALALAPQYAEAYNNLGNVRRAQGRFDEAAQCFARALALKPDYANAHYNLGLTREDEGDIDAAQSAYSAAIAVAPDHADAHWNKSLLHLLRGQYADGWREYEWRWQRKAFIAPAFSQPRWTGGDLTGRSILLLSEQGYGDTIQFIRYAALVRGRGARVIVQCPPALTKLVATAPGVDQVVATQEPLPAFDCYAPLLSLPHLFGTTLESVPAKTPYLFPAPAAVDAARTRLAQRSGRNVGLAWCGNPANTINPKKSLPIGVAAKLCAIPGVNWISLQADATPADLAALGGAVQDMGTGLRDWADTAAHVAALDLIISIDTGVAHLAGALGKELWVPLSFVPDWRWMLERPDSPWYPTARLFRQPAFGDWESVVEALRRALNRPAT